MISIFSFILVYSFIIYFNIKITPFWSKNKYFKTYFFIFFYGFVTSLFLLILHFQKGKYFFFILLESVKKTAVIKDPQEFLYILGHTGIVLFFCAFFMLIVFYFNTQILNVFRKQEYSLYLSSVFLFIYFIVIGGWLFFGDLITAHWEIFYQEDNFDFQPDLEAWYKYYKGESFDLFFWLFVFLIYFMLILFNFKNFNFLWYQNRLKEKNSNILIRFLPFIFISLFGLSFFGGESVARDVILIFTAFCIAELLIYSTLVFKKVKQYR